MVEKNAGSGKIEICIQLAGELKSRGDALVEKLNDPTEPPESSEKEIAAYNRSFEDLRTEMDALVVSGVSGDAKAIGRLVDALKALMETHGKIMESARNSRDHSKDRLAAISNAKDIFDKFVKKQPDGEAHFYDKRG